MHNTTQSSAKMSSPLRRGTGNISPANSQYERYISLMTDQISPQNRLRTHSRSSSTNPGERLHLSEHSYIPVLSKPYQVNPGVMYETGSITSLSSMHPSNLVAVGTKTKSLSLLIDRGNDFNKRRTLDYNNKRNNGNFNNSYNTPNNHITRTTYNKDYQTETQNYNNSQQKRQPRRFYSFINNVNNLNNNNNWERASADREISFGYHNTQAGMGGGARSLDREGLMQNYPENDIFSSSIHDEDIFLRAEGDNDTPSPGYFNNEPSSKDTYVLELQSQVAGLNKECAVLQQDLDLAKDKLTSTMNSIKSFWSPELKKERGLRKEDNSKYVSMCERLKSLEIENRQHVKSLVKLEQENRVLREPQQNASNNTPTNNNNKNSNIVSTGTGVGDYMSSISQQLQHKQPFQNTDLIKRERERHAKEHNLLKRTLQEMELRIETQQKTMATRDETIKKLMAFLQQHQQQKCQEVKRSLEGNGGRGGEGGGDGVDDGEKDSLIQSLYTQLQGLQDKSKLTEHERDLRAGELRLLHGRLESMEREVVDKEKAHVVLQGTLAQQEQQFKALQKELETYKGRLKDKDENLEAKMKQITTLQSERLRMSSELSSSNEQVDITKSALNSAAKKIERLEEELSESEALINSSHLQLSSFQADCSSHDGVVEGLKEIMMDKEKQIEKLKEQKERQQRNMEEEMKEMRERSNEVKVKVKLLQDDLLNKQEVELEVKNELGRLKSELNTKDKLMNRLETDICDVNDKLQQTKQLLNKTQDESQRRENDAKSRLHEVKVVMEESEKEMRDVRMEVEKLRSKKEKLEEMMAEKVKRISGLEAELVVLKRKGGGSGGYSGGGGGNDSGTDDDIDSVKSILQEKDGRINELESALRESIKITAQREVVMAEQQMRFDHTERMMETIQEEVESLKRSLEECREKLFKSEQDLKQKDELLKEQFNDSKTQLSEVYEMKQEAILAAISEKDAHIALLEMAPNKKVENIQEVEKLTSEKIKLQQVLRDLTQSRMKLLQSRGHMRSSSASSLLHYTTHRDQILEKVDFGTYYVYHNELLNEDDLL